MVTDCRTTCPSTRSPTSSPSSATMPWTSKEQRPRSGRCSSTLSTRPVDGSAEALDHHGHALAAADAHRLEAERLVVVLQRVDERRRDARARHAERMTDGDRTAVDVELVTERVDADAACGRDDLRGERLVDLDQVDAVDRHV